MGDVGECLRAATHVDQIFYGLRTTLYFRSNIKNEDYTIYFMDFIKSR